MRVVFIRSNPVSPDPRVEKEVRTLKNHQYDVRVIAWDRSSKYKHKTENLSNIADVKITRFGIPAIFGGGFKKNLFPLVKFQFRIIQWLFKNRNDYDLIHAADFDTALSSFLCAKLLRKKIIYDIFDSVTSPFNGPQMIGKLVEKIDIHLMNRVDAVIICTEFRRQQIQRANPKRMEVIHNTPSPVTSIKKLHFNENRIKIVYVGVLYSSRFIQELATVIIKTPHYELHIGGFGELEEELESLAKNYNNIIYYGKIAYEKTLELESNCDIMTAIYDPKLLNHYYAAPNKFYEALMLGKPLIMVKNTGMSNVVAEHNIGELMDYSIESLEEALKRLVERREEWPEISKKMNDLYEDEFSWSEMEKRLVHVYKELGGLENDLAFPMGEVRKKT